MNSKIDPSTLKITDMRFADIDGAPKRCTLIKIYTNQGIVGYGEVRDASSRTYAAMLKSRIIGENPCNVEKIFNRIKQFGGDSRQAGGVCGIEVALWDIAGKAWGVPVWQMLGGKYRDKIRIYCDTDSEGGGRDMGKALKDRMAQGYTFLKMDLGIELLSDVEGALSAPLGFLEKMRQYKKTVFTTPHGSIDPRAMRGEAYDLFNTAHPFTGIHITEKGLDYLEKYMADVRAEVGYEIPIAIDHVGHIPVEDCIKLCRRLEKYNLSWVEDPVPWQYTQQYVRLANSTTTPIATGEDIYLRESFKPLLESGVRLDWVQRPVSTPLALAYSENAPRFSTLAATAARRSASATRLRPSCLGRVMRTRRRICKPGPVLTGKPPSATIDIEAEGGFIHGYSQDGVALRACAGCNHAAHPEHGPDA